MNQTEIIVHLLIIAVMAFGIRSQLNMREKLRAVESDPENQLSPAAVSLLSKGAIFVSAIFGFILIGNFLHLAIDVYVWLH